MDQKPSCTGNNCCTPSIPNLRRRRFLQATALTSGAVALSGPKVMAGPFTDADFRHLVPLDKKLSPEWLTSLTARGTAPVWSGNQLPYVGMPCNGIGTGQVYLSGDGRLWFWGQLGKKEGDWITAGLRYKAPQMSDARLPIQGAFIKIGPKQSARIVPLDAEHFPGVRFAPRWPMGTAEFEDRESAVAVEVTGWTPFIPGDVERSSWPVSILEYKLENRGEKSVELELGVWLQNAIACSEEFRVNAARTIQTEVAADGIRMVRLGAGKGATAAGRPTPKSLLFAGFEDEDYGNWTVEGAAFGSRPVRLAEMPANQNVLNVQGEGFANSFAGSDQLTGILKSPEFTVELPFINFLIGGGSTRQTRVQLVIEGAPVMEVSGKKSDEMFRNSWDVSPFIGQKAQLHLIDVSKGGWGHIVADQFEFSDQPAPDASSGPVPALEALTDYGDMAIAITGEQSGTYARALSGETAARFLFKEGHALIEESMPRRPMAVVGKKVTLEPGQSISIPVVLAWHFKKTPTDESNFYAQRWPDAGAVIRALTPEWEPLRTATMAWVETWYDNTTLPWWIMERAIIPLDCLQTNTTFQTADGHYHFYEGVFCCGGNCTSVWHYAQALAYLFPEIERDVREHSDLGVAQNAEGRIGMRWVDVVNRDITNDAADGTAGIILRVLREHRFTTDDTFLRRVWPNTKLALEYQIDTYDKNLDGILEGGQVNTLDAAWWGKVPWITGLHIASLQAGAEMADEVGDRAFAQHCRQMLERGKSRFVDEFFDPDKGYFIMRPDPNHPNTSGSFDGCHIDQVMGQSLTHLLHLPRIIPEKETRLALKAIWDNNFTPDVGPYRREHPGGRWYAMPGEAGTILTTFPYGGSEDALSRGVANHSAYMNETMTGFEWQLAAHMVVEGLFTEGLAVGKAIYDRYAPERRNPFNEIECSDHYGRALASYGLFLNLCGFEYNGPRGEIGFAPRLTPERFMAPFTAAEGWGTFAQTLKDGRLAAVLKLRYGSLRLNMLKMECPMNGPASVSARLDGKSLKTAVRKTGNRLTVTFDKPLNLAAGAKLIVTCE